MLTNIEIDRGITCLHLELGQLLPALSFLLKTSNNAIEIEHSKFIYLMCMWLHLPNFFRTITVEAEHRVSFVIPYNHVAILRHCYAQTWQLNRALCLDTLQKFLICLFSKLTTTVSASVGVIIIGKGWGRIWQYFNSTQIPTTPNVNSNKYYGVIRITLLVLDPLIHTYPLVTPIYSQHDGGHC